MEIRQTQAGRRRYKIVLAAICVTALLASCAADPTVMKVSHYDDVKLDVMRQLTQHGRVNTKVAYVTINNPTGEQTDIKNLLTAELSAHGYQSVDKPEDAQVLLAVTLSAVGNEDKIYRDYGWMPRHNGGSGQAGITSGASAASLSGLGVFGATIAALAGGVADKEIHRASRARGVAMVWDVSVAVKDPDKKKDVTRIMASTENVSAGIPDARHRLEEETASAILRML